MLLQRLIQCLPMLIVFASACNPYDYQRGEYNAGPVDAANFPKPYQGVGADPNVNGYLSGKGTFTEIRAFINGANAGYYTFPFTTTQLNASDPLLLPSDSRRQPQAPIAYVFDPAPPSPFPSSQQCTPPAGYTYDPNDRNNDMRLDEQSNIFTLLPLATQRPGQASTFDYIPVVSEVAVSASGLACQSIKSEPTLKKVLSNQNPTGNFLLWAIIDPSSGVYRVGQQSTYLLPDGSPNPNFSPGIGVQKWGWFGHYYLAYIDGGYVPTQSISSGARMKTQQLYIPLRITPAGLRCGSATCGAGQICANNTCQTCNANRLTSADNCPTGGTCCPSPQTCINPDASGTCADIGKAGQGYDILQFKRGEASYSPVCEVRQYNLNIGSPARPPLISELPRNATAVLPLNPQQPTIESGIPRYIYCPQVD
jgi:hypothetical protein